MCNDGEYKETKLILKRNPGAGETGQAVECLLCKHKDPSSITSIHIKN